MLALAVSGGRDSRALALLARRWLARRRGKAVALVVDHGLREGAAAEAEQTRAWLTAQGIESEVLRWRPATQPHSRIQAAARAARYGMLLTWCRRNGVLHLLTAHQADDQAETYALRAAHRSGPAGLAAMSALVEFSEARLLRPLLSVPRARLAATLQASGHGWIDDPSNVDPRFARARLRRDGMPIHAAAAIQQAATFATRRAAHDVGVAMSMAQVAMPHPLGGVLIDHAAWLELPAAQAQAVVASAIVTVAGAEYPPRRERALRVVGQMRAVPARPERAPAGMTLGGCRLLWRGGGWLIVREPASVVAGGRAASSPGRWDGRFEICGKDGKTRECSVQVPPARPAARVPEGWQQAWPATAGLPALLATLPVLAEGRRLSPNAVAGSREAQDGVGKAGQPDVRACFRPVSPLASGPFFPCFVVAKGQIVNR